jgi:hypothetical protein
VKGASPGDHAESPAAQQNGLCVLNDSSAVHQNLSQRISRLAGAMIVTQFAAAKGTDASTQAPA